MNQKIIFLSLLMLISGNAMASAAGGGTMPWEGPLNTIQTSLTGPVAFAIALVAIAIGGAMLIFGGEINAFARTMIYIVLVAGMLVAGGNVLSGTYTSAATLPITELVSPTVIE